MFLFSFFFIETAVFRQKVFFTAIYRSFIFTEVIWANEVFEPKNDVRFERHKNYVQI